MYNIMTPGPTKVRENVRMARSLETTNPDLDPTFCQEYKDICDKIKDYINGYDSTYILSGEGILGLEAACASLTEKGDRVLVIDNGIFGKGFKDFVEIYGGEPVLFTTDYKKGVEPEELKLFLEKDSDYKYATLVHCDTPTGVLNPIETLCPILKEYGIMCVVDSVAAAFAVPVDVKKSKIDILCMGSQKAMSAPPGLTMVTVSPEAMKSMENRKTPIGGFYTNLLTFKNYYSEKWFPYTQPISDIYGLGVAVDNIYEKGGNKEFFEKHETLAAYTREKVKELGLTLYLEKDFCPTVTVINTPENVHSSQITEFLKKEYNVMIAGCFDFLEGKVIRIGHMGENCKKEDVDLVLEGLKDYLSK